MKSILRIVMNLTPFAAVILVVLQVVVSNELATLGKRMGELDQEITIESDLRLALETEVASASSLMAIRDRAKQSGFTDPTTKQIMNLAADVPVAFDSGNHAVRTMHE